MNRAFWEAQRDLVTDKSELFENPQFENSESTTFDLKRLPLYTQFDGQNLTVYEYGVMKNSYPAVSGKK